jgi:hypothetical protein
MMARHSEALPFALHEGRPGVTGRHGQRQFDTRLGSKSNMRIRD